MLYYAFSEGNLTKDLDTENILRYAAFSAIIILIAKRKFKSDDEKEEHQETKENSEKSLKLTENATDFLPNKQNDEILQDKTADLINYTKTLLSTSQYFNIFKMPFIFLNSNNMLNSLL